MNNALESAIYSKLKNAAGLTQYLADSDSIYAYAPLENAALPLVVYFEQDGSPDYTLAVRAFNQWLYGIKTITATTMKDAKTIDAQIDLLMGDATLTVDGKSTMSCRRERSISPYTTLEDGVRYNHCGGSYRIYLGA